MKQKTQKKVFKIILLLYLVASITSASFVSCFAENVIIVVYRDFASNGYFTCYKGNTLVYDRAISSGPNNFSLETDIVYKCLVYHVSAGVRCKIYLNNITELSTDPSNPTVITANDVLWGSNYSTGSNSTYYYFIIVSATPTPDPTPTPTPIPEDFDDITFWEDMGTKATGIWSLITQFFNGIFSNTILRNIVVYIPLFSLILAFVIVLIKLGG